MEFITGKYISRRSFVRGMGATVALPFLDAMVPAGRPWRDLAADPRYTRLVCIEESMGSAGGSSWGDAQHLFAPAKTGRDFEFLPTSQLAPLEEFRDYLTIVSNTDMRNADAFKAPDVTKKGAPDDAWAAFFKPRRSLKR